MIPQLDLLVISSAMLIGKPNCVYIVELHCDIDNHLISEINLEDNRSGNTEFHIKIKDSKQNKSIGYSAIKLFPERCTLSIYVFMEVLASVL